MSLSPSNSEAQRQADLMQAIVSFQADAPAGWQAPPLAQQAMHAYQGHVRVLAAQVLAQTFPSLKRLLGDEPWPHMAQAFWQAHPPTQAHLHRWGAAMPEWVAQQSAWQAWPFLADMARLDWAQHLSLLADTHPCEADSLMLLGQDSTDANDLILQLQPNLQLLQSDWPVVQIHIALDARVDKINTDASTIDLKHIVLTHAAENACVMGAHIQSMPADWFNFMVHARATDTPSLETLLSDHSGIDFTAWLTAALQHGWLLRIKRA